MTKPKTQPLADLHTYTQRARARYGAQVHAWSRQADRSACNLVVVPHFVGPDTPITCFNCVAVLAHTPAPRRRAETQVQRPEVVINGKLHRRPDRGSDNCTCGWKPGQFAAGHSDGPGRTWVEHISRILLTLEHRK